MSTSTSASGRQRPAKVLSIEVLMGGVSPEREISLLTGRAVVKALHASGHQVRGTDVRGWAQIAALVRRRPDVAVICLHGEGGEDGRLQGVLEWAGIPYTGSGILASALAMDKARSKHFLRDAGLPTAPWTLIHRGDRWPAGFRLPAVVKPNRAGSAIGISVVRTSREAAAALVLAGKVDREILIEAFCPGREISVGVLTGTALPVVEIVPKKSFYDYEAKYVSGMSEHLLPARLSPAETRRAQRLAEDAHRALGCRGATRVDIIVGARGRMTILEVNTIPGMTATSLLPEAARHAGIPFVDLVLRLIREALEAGR